MPIWLRKFTHNKISKEIDRQNAQNDPDSPNSTTLINSKGEIKSPEFLKQSQPKRSTNYK